MSDLFGRIRPEDQLVYLNSGKLLGVQSISINPSFGMYPLKYVSINKNPINQILNNEQYIDSNINLFLINQDNFIQYTGIDCFNIFVLKSSNDLDNNYCLISGYLNSYNAKFSIGKTSEISCNIKFVNNGGKIPTGALDSNSSNQLQSIPNQIYKLDGNTYNIPSFGSLNLQLNEIQTNRVTECSIDLQIDRQIVYTIGSRVPSKIKIIYPIAVNCTFNIEINKDYSGMLLQDFPHNQQVQDVSISVYDHVETGNLITSYNFKNLTCIKEDISSATDSNLILTKVYQGYIYN